MKAKPESSSPLPGLLCSRVSITALPPTPSPAVSATQPQTNASAFQPQFSSSKTVVLRTSPGSHPFVAQTLPPKTRSLTSATKPHVKDCLTFEACSWPSNLTGLSSHTQTVVVCAWPSGRWGLTYTLTCSLCPFPQAWGQAGT